MVWVVGKVYMVFSLGSGKSVRTDAFQCPMFSSSHLSWDVTVLGNLLLPSTIPDFDRGSEPFVVSVVSNAAEHTYRRFGR